MCCKASGEISFLTHSSKKRASHWGCSLFGGARLRREYSNSARGEVHPLSRSPHANRWHVAAGMARSSLCHLHQSNVSNRLSGQFVTLLFSLFLVVYNKLANRSKNKNLTHEGINMKKTIRIIAFILVLLSLAGCSLDASKLTASLITVAVPNVVGLDREAAEARCAKSGFATETIFVEADAPANTVISTDPAANTKAHTSSVVKLFCSQEKTAAVRIPNVIGKSLDDAKTALTSQGLKIGNMTYESSSKAKDTVTLTDPLPGCEVPAGSAIDLTLSSGARKESKLKVVVELPDSDVEMALTVYVDGILDRSKTVLPSVVGQTSFEFSGTEGKKTVSVFVDGVIYKTYLLDFDKGLVTEQ